MIRILIASLVTFESIFFIIPFSCSKIKTREEFKLVAAYEAPMSPAYKLPGRGRLYRAAPNVSGERVAQLCDPFVSKELVERKVSSPIMRRIQRNVSYRFIINKKWRVKLTHPHRVLLDLFSLHCLKRGKGTRKWT